MTLDTRDTQFDHSKCMLSPEECIAEAKQLAPLIAGRGNAGRNVDTVARLLELKDISRMKLGDFCFAAGLTRTTMGYYAKHLNSRGKPWPELEQRRSRATTANPSSETRPGQESASRHTPSYTRIVGVNPDGALVMEAVERLLIEKTDPKYNIILCQFFRQTLEP